ncbi:MAG: ABC transporter permease [Methyloprofundus sp.]|nr:ABC transporter permease [Methyloprofundus sp.]
MITSDISHAAGQQGGLWQYRHFVLSSIRNEMISRFSRSKLGGLWMIINPLSQVLIYALIFSNVLASKLPDSDNKYSYAFYLLAGQLAWMLFNEVITRSLNIFIEQGDLMKKMSFPRSTLPAIAIGSSLLNNFFLLIAVLGIFLVFGQSFSLLMLWLIPLTFVVIILAMGIGLILGIFNVFLRDIGHVVPIVLQVWFWFTPIVYPEKIIPEKYRHLMEINPMYTMVNAYHDILVYQQAPQLESIAIVLAGALAMLLLSLFIFRRASAEMVDVL